MAAWTNGSRLTLLLGAAVSGLVLAVLSVWGWNEASLRLVVRLTARTSLLLFLAAFVASAVRRRWPRPVTAWLRRNRRYVGLGFAESHLLHLLALVALGRWFPAALAGVPWATLVVGGGGFVVVGLLAATSSDAAVRWLGGRRWSALHRTGIYYLWAVFTLTYLSHGILLPAVLVAALVLRLRG